ncbi:EF hand domain-containing protein [Caballeronia catudaia]|uniref:EF hand domain-containing protein n=1 Tax=Caballeronia catudaia TaxID=1777136 RepID=A0A158DUE5_9BURK|nr:EF hand domain-containing protein [Caballeronia catudaia]
MQSGAARDDAGVQWWNVAVGDANGRTSWGWLCEKDHPNTEWQSPWSWPGFELIDSSSITPLNMFKRFLFVTDQLFDGEAEEFSVVAASINKGEFIGKLEKAVDLQGDNNGKVTAKELREALKTRWLASALSHVSVRYESEWGGSMSKWDALSSLMGDGQYIWQGELERIQKLLWWDKVAEAVKGFPQEPIAWHLHPIGIVGNFMQTGPSRDSEQNDFTEEDAKRALRHILDKYGREIAEVVERMYRTETRHFQSMQFRRCGTGGMEVHGGPPFYGWSESFYTEPPTGVWSAFEGAGLSGAGGNAQVTNKKRSSS